jgi:dinuclear metal center YbgI/SA1388 family protein
LPLADLVTHLGNLLSPQLFKDYGPNGLQVDGRPRVTHLVTGVTASLAFIEAAVAAGADAVLVHHGLFWRGYEGRITGWLHRRIKALMANDISLLAYHLPLDAHPTLGNNAQLARVLGFQMAEGPAGRFGDQNLGFLGMLAANGPRTLGELAAHTRQRLGREVTCVGTADQPLGTVAWCTGGAQSYFEAAIAAGASVFITGEISEPQAHYARECGVAYLACGHHATERYGVQAVGEHLAHTLGLRHTFIDIDNPA